jgi:hypothetical protein
MFVCCKCCVLSVEVSATGWSSGLLRGVSWFKTDVSKLPIGSLFKG